MFNCSENEFEKLKKKRRIRIIWFNSYLIICVIRLFWITILKWYGISVFHHYLDHNSSHNCWSFNCRGIEQIVIGSLILIGNLSHLSEGKPQRDRHAKYLSEGKSQRDRHAKWKQSQRGQNQNKQKFIQNLIQNLWD